jgi:hypothetical protein
MKKLLVLATAVTAAVALAGLAFAAGPACPPPTKCEYFTSNVPAKGMYEVPKRVKPQPGKCVTVPAPPVRVTVPGPPYAVAKLPVNVWIKDTAPIYRDICSGQAKGKVIPCGPCPPTITYAVNWKTSVECGKVAYKFMVPPGHLVRRPAVIEVKTKTSPIVPDCLF